MATSPLTLNFGPVTSVPKTSPITVNFGVGGYVQPVFSGQIVLTLGSVESAIAAVIGNDASVSLLLDELTVNVSGKVEYVNVGTTSFNLDNLTPTITVEYDANVHRYLTSSLYMGCDQGESHISSLHLPVQQMQGYSNVVNMIYGVGLVISQKSCMLLSQATALFSQTLIDYENGLLVSQGKCMLYEQATPLYAKLCSFVENAKPVSIWANLPIEQGIAYQSVVAMVSEDMIHEVHRFTFTGASLPPLQHRYTPGFSFAWNPTITVSQNVDVLIPLARTLSPLAMNFQLLPVDQHTYNFTRTYPTTTITYVSHETSSVYAPTYLFVIAWQVVYDEWVIEDSTGGIRSTTCLPCERTTFFAEKRCMPLEQAKTPPWGIPVVLDPPRDPPYVPPGHTTYTIPTQDSYTMLHTITVTLLDLTPIALSSFNLSCSADSFTWSFSGTLEDTSDVALVKRNLDGSAVQLIITVDGYQWKVLVEEITRSRRHGTKTISLTGRGLTALLGAPYVTPSSITYGSDLTVQQIADLQMPADWTIDWQAPTWLVPTGAYSYQNMTSIQAVVDIAQKIGAAIVPSRNTKSLKIKPRYPYFPWEFSLVPADVVIPDSAIFEITERPVIPTQGNGVYVQGTSIGGVLGFCRLNGTAGEKLLASVSNELMTHVDACRMLGSKLLADQQEQPVIQSAVIPLDTATFPLLEVGQLVQINDGATQVKGIVNSVGLNVTLGQVRQSFQMGAETPNQWMLFQNLVPSDPLLYSTLVSTNGLTSIMALLDGGTVRVRGTGTVGNKYYIRNGKIENEAPNLTANTIVV